MTRYQEGFFDGVGFVMWVIVICVGGWAIRKLLWPEIDYYGLSLRDLRRAKQMPRAFGRACRVCSFYNTPPAREWGRCLRRGGRVSGSKTCDDWQRANLGPALIISPTKLSDKAA